MGPHTLVPGHPTPTHAESWDNANGVLKVSPLGWTVDDLELNPRICFEFKDGFSLEDVLRTPGQLQYSAFDPTKGCCAVSSGMGRVRVCLDTAIGRTLAWGLQGVRGLADPLWDTGCVLHAYQGRRFGVHVHCPTCCPTPHVCGRHACSRL